MLTTKSKYQIMPKDASTKAKRSYVKKTSLFPIEDSPIKGGTPTRTHGVNHVMKTKIVNTINRMKVGQRFMVTGTEMPRGSVRSFLLATKFENRTAKVVYTGTKDCYVVRVS
jgi:hypothetical protein